MNLGVKLGNRYRSLPSGATSIFAAAIAFVLAVVGGFLGAFAAMYLYDGARSKGDDLTIGLGGFFGFATFIFVILFTWLQKTHHSISSRTSFFAFYFCLVLPVLVTIASLSEIDDHYLPILLGSWLVILILGLLSLLLCRPWWRREEQGF